MDNQWHNQTIVIINHNIAHFGQARESPFIKHNITDDFGFTGVTLKARQLIQGCDMESSFKELGHGERMLLQQLKHEQNLQSINIIISCEEFQSGFRN